jgi:hypothetical protein
MTFSGTEFTLICRSVALTVPDSSELVFINEVR